MTPEEEYDAMARQERAEPKRLLPASDVAERGVVCSLLLAPREVGHICHERECTSEWFHRPALGAIFGVLFMAWEANELMDSVLLTQRLADQGRLESVGGAALIADLFTYLPTATNVKYYLDILFEKYIARQIVETGTKFSERAMDADGESLAVLEKFEKRVMELRPIGRNVRCYSGRDIARMAMDSLSRRLERADEIAGLTTGFPDLDLKTDGMHDTELIVLAGRPGTGKSSMSGQIAEYLAVDKQIPVGIFSLEMGAQLLSERCVASRARVNVAPWRDGKVPTQGDLQRIETARDEYHRAPIWIEELSDATVQQLRTSARRGVQQHGWRFIIIDSLSKVRSNSKQGRDSREREVSEAIGGCKEIAKELKLPVLVIAHLRRPDHQEKFGARPALDRLRESGAIEQDADSVWMLYQREDGTMGLYLPKQRAGASDEECAFYFVGSHTRFRPVQTQEEEADAEARRQRELPLWIAAARK